MDDQNRPCPVPKPAPGPAMPEPDCVCQGGDAGPDLPEPHRLRWLDTASRYFGLGPLASVRSLV